MNLPVLMILGLAFCLTEHNKCCALPCAIFISMLYTWNIFEKKEEICICIYSVPRAAQSFPTRGGNNEEGLAVEQGRIWGLESMFPFADTLPLTSGWDHLSLALRSLTSLPSRRKKSCYKPRRRWDSSICQVRGELLVKISSTPAVIFRWG